MAKISRVLLASILFASLWLSPIAPAKCEASPGAGSAASPVGVPRQGAVSAPALQQTDAASQQGAPDDRVPLPSPTPFPVGEEPPSPLPDVADMLSKMTVADKTGHLFLVAVEGDDVSEGSDIANLVRDLRVGGVVLLPSNGNFSTVPVPIAALAPVTAPGQAAPSVTQPGETSAETSLSTPQQILGLTNALQLLALSAPQPITSSTSITLSPALTDTAVLSATAGVALPTVAATVPITVAAPVPGQLEGVRIPLLIGLDWPGDDSGLFSGRGGFTPLPSSMAIGATWSSQLSERIGRVLGQELRAVGVSLLLGPTLDVLDVPRPGNKGDLGTRTFGGDPFWVGQMGRAMIRGIQEGSQGSVLTAAKHFPGQGGSDRRPEDEVATIQKSMQQLRQIELAPFATVTGGGDLRAPGTTGALMTSHIRYRGFQGNIRQLTPPISLAPQLQDLMTLEEFASWRAAGGLLISDALGVPALRRYYDPSLQKFPHRQVAQDAFLAGNDLLYLSRFALSDSWPDELAAIKETIQFFQDKYQNDSEFRTRVDASVERIVRAKLSLYGGDWEMGSLQHNTADLAEQVGHGSADSQAVARAGLTLIYPGPDELADRLPTAPLADEKMLIITDARPVQECKTPGPLGAAGAGCEPVPAIQPNALQEVILRLYGPSATGQVAAENVRSLTYDDLNRLLEAAPGQEAGIEQAIVDAKWIIFAQLDDSPEDYPASSALREFLARRSDSLRDKKLVGLAFSAPYYLDTTEISKLTAYFGVYAKTAPFLDTAVRALFREFSPVGAPPVTVSGINYELIRELEPAPGQIIGLVPIGPPEVISGSIGVGSQVIVETAVILDRKGHPVPDGTPVEFHKLYPAEALALAPNVETTVGGKAVTTVVLDRPGELWITAQAGEAKDSTRVELKVGGDAPGSIATVVPTPTPLPTVTLTPTALPTSTATLTPMPSPRPIVTPAPEQAPPKPRVALAALLFALMGAVISGGAAFAIRWRSPTPAVVDHNTMVVARGLTAALWAGIAAWIAYLLYAVGWLPGATRIQAGGHAWAAGAITLLAGMLSVLWSVYWGRGDGVSRGQGDGMTRG